MTLFSSLTNRIFLACTLLAVATTGVAVYVVGARATHEAETELARGLADAATQVAQHQRALVARYVVFARLLADLPKLGSGLRRGTIRRSLAADYRRRSAPTCCSSTAATARCSREAATGAATLRRRRCGARWRARGARVPATPARHPAGRHDSYLHRPRRPDVLGTLSLGVLLDERLADQLKHATQAKWRSRSTARCGRRPCRAPAGRLLSLADKSAATASASRAPVTRGRGTQASGIGAQKQVCTVAVGGSLQWRKTAEEPERYREDLAASQPLRPSCWPRS
jgi:hypothetical protein